MMSNFEHSARCPKRHADDTDCECGADLNASLRAERDALKADREAWIATNTEVIAGTVKTDRINQELRARLATIEQETIERCAKVAHGHGVFDHPDDCDCESCEIPNSVRDAILALLPVDTKPSTINHAAPPHSARCIEVNERSKGAAYDPYCERCIKWEQRQDRDLAAWKKRLADANSAPQVEKREECRECGNIHDGKCPPLKPYEPEQYLKLEMVPRKGRDWVCECHHANHFMKESCVWCGKPRATPSKEGES
jgi:hypothetical protein